VIPIMERFGGFPLEFIPAKAGAGMTILLTYIIDRFLDYQMAALSHDIEYRFLGFALNDNNK